MSRWARERNVTKSARTVAVLAMILSWAGVALVRALDGRFWQASTDKDPNSSSGAQLLRSRLRVCVSLVLADLASKLNVAGLIDPAGSRTP